MSNLSVQLTNGQTVQVSSAEQAKALVDQMQVTPEVAKNLGDQFHFEVKPQTDDVTVTGEQQTEEQQVAADTRKENLNADMQETVRASQEYQDAQNGQDTSVVEGEGDGDGDGTVVVEGDGAGDGDGTIVGSDGKTGKEDVSKIKTKSPFVDPKTTDVENKARETEAFDGTKLKNYKDNAEKEVQGVIDEYSKLNDKVNANDYRDETKRSERKEDREKLQSLRSRLNYYERLGFIKKDEQGNIVNNVQALTQEEIQKIHNDANYAREDTAADVTGDIASKTKDEIKSEYDVSGRAARRMRRNADKVTERTEAVMNLKGICTKKGAYNDLKAEAKRNKTWDSSAPEYTYADEKTVAAFEKAFDKMKGEGKFGANDKLYDAEGNIDVSVAQKIAQELAGSDKKADWNEAKRAKKDYGLTRSELSGIMKATNYKMGANYNAIASMVGAVTTVATNAALTATNALHGHPGKDAVTETQIVQTQGGGASGTGAHGTGNYSGGTYEALTVLVEAGIASTLGTVALAHFGISLAAGILAGALTKAILVASDDKDILKKHAKLNDLPDLAATVKNKDDQKIIEKIITTAEANKVPNETTLKLIMDAYGAGDGGGTKEATGKFNRKELLGALASVQAYVAEEKPGEKAPEAEPEQPADEPEQHEPVTTNVSQTIYDIDGNGFIRVDNEGKTDNVDEVLQDPTDENGEPTAVEKKGAKGRARDIELLKKRRAASLEDDTQNINSRAQFVQADDIGETQITIGTGTVDAPEKITLKCNTNKKDNTYTYRKLSPEEVTERKAKGDIPTADKGPFYILESVTDNTNGDIRESRHDEIYELEFDASEKETVVHTEKDENSGDTTVTTSEVIRPKYNLEQRKDYAGSSTTSMFWKHRAH